MLDVLLPIVDFDPTHEDVQLSGILKYYAYFLKVMDSSWPRSSAPAYQG